MSEPIKNVRLPIEVNQLSEALLELLGRDVVYHQVCGGHAKLYDVGSNFVKAADAITGEPATSIHVRGLGKGSALTSWKQALIEAFNTTGFTAEIPAINPDGSIGSQPVLVRSMEVRERSNHVATQTGG